MPELKTLVPPNKKKQVDQSVATKGKSGRVFRKKRTLGEVPETDDEFAERMAKELTSDLPQVTTIVGERSEEEDERSGQPIGVDGHSMGDELDLNAELDPLLAKTLLSDAPLTREEQEIFEREGEVGLRMYRKVGEEVFEALAKAGARKKGSDKTEPEE